jgi:hypothetical protein
MKGKISKQLEAILRDPRGREQLREHLLNGKDGRIRTAEGSYLFHAGAHQGIKSGDKEKPRG